MITFDSIFELLINSVFIGIGTGIGSYFAQKHLIKRIEEKLVHAD